MKENGFSLVEMLVVLAIGALLLTGVSSAISGFAPALKRVQAQENKAQARLALQQLDELIGGARFLDKDGKLLPYGDDWIEFDAPLPMSANLKGLYRHKLSVQQSKQGKSLRLAVKDKSLELPDSILVKEAFQIALSPMIETPSGGDEKKLTKITVSVTFADASNIQIFSQPNINAQGSCIFDLISQACRK